MYFNDSVPNTSHFVFVVAYATLLLKIFKDNVFANLLMLYDFVLVSLEN